MAIEPGTCPECNEHKYLMARTKICRQCYSRLYYQENKKRYQEYYHKLSATPEPAE